MKKNRPRVNGFGSCVLFGLAISWGPKNYCYGLGVSYTPKKKEIYVWAFLWFLTISYSKESTLLYAEVAHEKG